MTLSSTYEYMNKHVNTILFTLLQKSLFLEILKACTFLIYSDSPLLYEIKL